MSIPSNMILANDAELMQGIDEICEHIAEAANSGLGLIHNAADIGRDGMAITTASIILRFRDDPAYAATIESAAKELERLVELNSAGLTNHSQREYAGSLREDRNRARLILHQVWEDPAIQHYWAEREHYKRPPELTISEQRDLNRLVANHFKDLPTVAGMIEQMHARGH